MQGWVTGTEGRARENACLKGWRKNGGKYYWVRVMDIKGEGATAGSRLRLRLSEGKRQCSTAGARTRVTRRDVQTMSVRSDQEAEPRRGEARMGGLDGGRG